MVGDIVPHELAQYLSGRPVLGSAGFEELVPKIALNANPQTCVLGFHQITLTDGYTNVYPNLRQRMPVICVNSVDQPVRGVRARKGRRMSGSLRYRNSTAW
jgi:hypothetical protein